METTLECFGVIHQRPRLLYQFITSSISLTTHKRGNNFILHLIWTLERGYSIKRLVTQLQSCKGIFAITATTALLTFWAASRMRAAICTPAIASHSQSVSHNWLPPREENDRQSRASSKRWKSSQPVAKWQIEWRPHSSVDISTSQIELLCRNKRRKIDRRRAGRRVRFFWFCYDCRSRLPGTRRRIPVFLPLAWARRHSGKKRPLSFSTGTLCEWAAESRSHLGTARNLIEARC
jgi:hypothetical protein